MNTFSNSSLETCDAIVIARGTFSQMGASLSIQSDMMVKGEPSLNRVLKALGSATSINKILVIMPPGASRLTSDVGYTNIAGTNNVLNDVFTAAESLDSERRALVIPGNLAAMTPAAINRFVEQTGRRRTALAIGLVSKSDMTSQFPGAHYDFAKFDGDMVTAANVFSLRCQSISRLRRATRELFDSGKSQTAIARMFGLGFIAKAASGSLGVSDIELKLFEVLGINISIISAHDACLAAAANSSSNISALESKL